VDELEGNFIEWSLVKPKVVGEKNTKNFKVIKGIEEVLRGSK
jgi:hypothetical protein